MDARSQYGGKIGSPRQQHLDHYMHLRVGGENASKAREYVSD